jgi:hypothetical protein
MQPLSTTHVLSSGVAGTMAANGSGLQMSTPRNIACLGADASGSDGRRPRASRRAGGTLEHGVVEHRFRQKLLQLCVLVTVRRWR